MNWKWLSLAALVLLIGAVAGLFSQHAIIARGTLAMVVQVLAVAVILWARVTFGWRSFHATANPTRGGLVTTGPYRFLRHPIYAGVVYFILVGTLPHPSVANYLLVVVALVATGVRIVSEERLIVERYPEYTAYAARTRRIIPFVF